MRASGRIASFLAVALGWMLFAARTTLDFIGYSTAPEDFEVAKTRLGKGIDLLLATPWWALLGFALISTLFLIWYSWPRQRSTADPSSIAKAITEEQYALDDLFAEGVVHRNRCLMSKPYDIGEAC